MIRLTVDKKTITVDKKTITIYTKLFIYFFC